MTIRIENVNEFIELMDIFERLGVESAYEEQGITLYDMRYNASIYIFPSHIFVNERGFKWGRQPFEASLSLNELKAKPINYTLKARWCM